MYLLETFFSDQFENDFVLAKIWKEVFIHSIF